VASWEKLAEARIREWLARPAHDRPGAAIAGGPVLPLELQLLEDVLRLRDEAAACADPAESDALRRQATDLETRLLIVLESSGRPLAAQHFAQLFLEIRRGVTGRAPR
jgi:hypothetical protein